MATYPQSAAHGLEEIVRLETEIDRLTRELADTKANALHWAEYESETWKAMKADNERLRTELKKIADYEGDIYDAGPQFYNIATTAIYDEQRLSDDRSA